MATATNSHNTNKSNQGATPAYARRHRRLQVAVWQNESEKGVYFSTNLQRSYKDGDDWKKSQASLNRDDLLVAAKLLNWAHSAVTAASAKNEKPTGNKPVSSQKYRNLEVAVWRQEGEDGTFFTVSLQRNYKVDDEYKSTSISLGNNDLLSMSRLLELAHDAIDDLYEEGDFTAVESALNESGSDDIPF